MTELHTKTWNWGKQFSQASAVALMAGLMATGAVYAQDVPSQEVNEELRDLLPDSIKEAGAIVAAGAFDNPPSIFADLNDPDRAVGVAPDLSRAVGEILGVEIDWRNTQWPGQLPGLDGGTFDILLGQISVTAQRERELIDLIPWSQNGLGFLVLEGNPTNISGWASVCGQVVGVSLGSIFVETLTNASAKYCEGAEPIEYKEYQGNEEPALRAGHVNAVLDGHSVMEQMAAGIPGVEAVQIPTEESFEMYPGLTGVAVKKENPGLSQAIAGAMQILHDNGTWQAIAEKYDASADIPSRDLVRINALTDTPVGEIAN